MSIVRFLYSSLISFSVVFWCCLSVTIAFILQVVTWNRKSAFWIARNFCSPGILRIAGVSLEITGKENLDPSRPVIFVMNHQSFLDIPAAFVALQSDLHFIGKKELKYLPFIGWFMQMVGMIFVDRKNRTSAVASIRKAAELIRSGHSVLAFPEGTRSLNGKIGPLKKGIFLTALEAQVPIVPVVADGAYRLLPHGNFFIRSGVIRIVIGSPIELGSYSYLQREKLLHDVRLRLNNMQNELLLGKKNDKSD